MNTHQLIPVICIVAGISYLAWSVVRSRKWDRYQAEAANRSKTIIAKASRDEERFNEVMSNSREQLQIAKELLSEIKGLREDLRKGSGPPV